MKKLIIINGTMGMGKSTVSELLLKKLSPSVYLDGDWCWNMHPFIVNDENKEMVQNNITNLLRAFLNNSSLEYIIFCWVIHEENIFDLILNPLSDLQFDLHKITLISSEEELVRRINEDIKRGKRKENDIARSVDRLKKYMMMDTIKIDTTTVSPEAVADEIVAILHQN